MKTIYQTLLLFLISCSVFSQNESDFYKETIQNYKSAKNLKTDFGINGKGNDDDSKKLQKAIDEVANSGGGILYFPLGTYKLGEIDIKSNIHFKFEEGVIILPNFVKPGKSLSIFNLDNGISNVSFRSTKGKYIAQFPLYEPGIKLFACGSVTNFLISDFEVQDHKTKFSCITMGISATGKSAYSWPTNGVVKNCDVKDAHYGYGLIQAQAAEHVLFKDIQGEGGATLRLETGLKKMNDLQKGGVKDMYAYTISCLNGNAAVMISPHSMNNGAVYIDGVKAINCGFAVRVDNGFVSKKYENKAVKAGSFSKVVVKNVEATFGTTAQIKEKHYKYIPVYREQFMTKTSYDGESYIGPSIAAVLNDVKTYADVVSISNVKANGFLCQKPVITEADVHSTMNCEQK